MQTNKMTKDLKYDIPMDIPVTSPYYDRIQALNNELDFAPYGSPSFRYLTQQIGEMVRRARNRMGQMATV